MADCQIKVLNVCTTSFKLEHATAFKASASFYGVCHRLSSQAELGGTTTIFIGADDDRATTHDCDELVKRSRLNNESVSIMKYKKALHGFDNFEFPLSKEIIDEKGEHYHIGYYEPARLLAIQDLLGFFASNLKK